MALSSILREFLVKISFQADDTSKSKFIEGVKGATEVVLGLGAAIETTAGAIILGVEKMSNAMERFYFVSQRTGASVASIKALGFAGEQMGIGAGAAESAIENIAGFLRSSPGAQGFLQQLGINSQDPEKIFVGLEKKFQDMPVYMAKAYAQVLGIDENTMLAMRRGMGDYLSTYDAILKKVGVNEENAAKAAHGFMVQFRNATALMQVFSDRVLELVAGKAGDYINKFTKAVTDNFDKITQVTEHVISWILNTAEVFARLAVRGVQAMSDLYDGFVSLPPVIKLITEVLIALTIATWALERHPIVALITAIGGAILLLYDDFKTFKEGGKHFIDWPTWIADFDYAKAKLHEWWNDLVGMWVNNTYHIRTITESFALIPILIYNHWEWLKGFFKDLWGGIINTFKDAWAYIEPIITRLKGATDWIANSWLGKKLGAAADYVKTDFVNQSLPDADKFVSTEVGDAFGVGPYTTGQGLPDGLLDAVSTVESGNRDSAVSPRGAKGRFQFMPDTAKQYGLSDPTNPVAATKAATSYLSDLLAHYSGNLREALAGYNWGQGNVDKDIASHGADWEKFVPAETSSYIAKVLAEMRMGRDPANANINQTNTYNINGATDPKATAAAVGVAQNTSNARLIRNMTATAH